MAKVEALEWKSFFKGEVKSKEDKKAFDWNRATKVAAVGVIALTAVSMIPLLASAKSIAVTVMADPSFQQQLTFATKPIRDLINGFAHEIYFVFMSWGAMEAMIGKPAQGFTRMKTATFAYILLFWVPWIVDKVSLVRPL